MSEKRRIAVFAHSLRGPRPRGVQRVARALTEELVEMLPQEVELHCLLQKIDNQPEITYSSCDLRAWLALNPLTVPEKKNIVARCTRIVRKVVSLATPPIIPKVVGALVLLMHRYGPRIPSVQRMIGRWNALTRMMGRYSALGQSAQWMALDEFDIVISFEPFDEIWNAPTHRARTRFITFFWDAIPKRIHEGVYWNPDRFDAAVSNSSYRAHRILCISRSAEQDLLTFFPPAAGKTQVNYLGHDLERFARGAAANQAQSAEVLARHGISQASPYFLVLGAVEVRKNIVNVLHACELLRRNHPRLDFQLVMAGETSSQPEMRELLARVRRHVPVRLLKYTRDNDVAILAARATAVLYPSLWEGFGIPMLESMTAGTPVVAGNLASMPEVAGPHAIYCDPYDARDMAAQFLRCLTMEPEERRSLVDAARQHAAQFTWRQSAKTLLRVIEQELTVTGDLREQQQQQTVPLPIQLRRQRTVA